MSAEAANLTTTVLAGGFATAVVFGWVASRSNFCTMGAISDVVNIGHWGRMRMWLLAIAVAIAGTALLSATGEIKLADAVALRPTLRWLSLLVGGLVFGIGMTLAGGCANRNLLRLGGGSLRSLVVLVFMGIAAYMTLKGLFAAGRVRFLDPFSVDLGARGWTDQSLASALAKTLGIDANAALVGGAIVLVLALVAFVFSDRRFRGNRWQVIGGTTIGLVIVAGWYVTGKLGFGESPETMENVYFATNSRTIESMSFVAPIAYSLEYLMLWTDSSMHASFGIASAAGVVAGSALHALSTGAFRWEGFASYSDLWTQLVGSVLMGFGGVTALGCTVGQGLTGLSTLALGSFLAVFGIVAGCVVTLKILVWQAQRED